MTAPAIVAEAIVTGRTDQGEVDRVVRLLSPDLGLIAAYATGARRPRSVTGVLDVGVRAKVGLRRGNGDLWRLGSVEVLDPRVHLRTSVERLTAAAYAVEVCAALAPREHSEPRLYGLLEMALLLLDGTTAAPGTAFLAGIEAKALTFAGVAPTLDRCVVCGRRGEGNLWFDVGAGGLRHDTCGGMPHGEGRRAPSLEQVPHAYAEALEAARRRPLRESLDVSLPAGPPRLLADLIEAHVGHALHSRATLDALC